MIDKVGALVLAVGLSGGSLFAQPTQWSRLTIDQVYEHWNVHNPFATVEDVINLNPPPALFMNQSLANAHVVVPDSQTGDWLVVCYGTRLVPPGDSIYVFKRYAEDGDYEVPTTPALAGAAGHGLGAGAGVVKAPSATVTGRRIFALVPVLGNPGWLTWASLDANGTTWSFLSPTGGTVTDPVQSIRLIARSDFADRWQHPAIVHANVLGVDYFFIAIGYASDTNTCGIPAIWFRLQFDASNPNGFGLKANSPNVYKIQRWNGSAYVDTNGLVTNAEACTGAAPLAGGDSAADPMDLVSLKKVDGTLDSILFVYVPANGGYRDPKRVMYSKASLPATATGNLQFGAFRVLDTSVLWDRATFPTMATHTYSSCGSGGGTYMSVNQGADPATQGQLFSFISTFRSDEYDSADPGCWWNCGNQPQGLLPVRLKQQSLGVDSISPTSGPRSGGTAITILGEGFIAPPTVKVGGATVAGVAVTMGGTKITGTTSAHSAGVGSVQVINPSPNDETDVKANAFVFDFDDVAAAHPYHDYVAAITRARVTAGCGSNIYCPDNPVTRGQMSAFLLKGRYGFGYPPPPPEPVPFFTDVPPTHQFAKWIDEFFRMGITAGCSGTGTCTSPNGNTQYCPDAAIPREQMAVFLFKTATYTGNPILPPSCQGSGVNIRDVACPSMYADYIYEAVKKGYMLKCGNAPSPFVCSSPCQVGDFCPNATVKRKEMAQHIATTFGLQ